MIPVGVFIFLTRDLFPDSARTCTTQFPLTMLHPYGNNPEGRVCLLLHAMNILFCGIVFALLLKDRNEIIKISPKHVLDLDIR